MKNRIPVIIFSVAGLLIGIFLIGGVADKQGSGTRSQEKPTVSDAASAPSAGAPTVLGIALGFSGEQAVSVLSKSFDAKSACSVSGPSVAGMLACDFDEGSRKHQLIVLFNHNQRAFEVIDEWTIYDHNATELLKQHPEELNAVRMAQWEAAKPQLEARYNIVGGWINNGPFRDNESWVASVGGSEKLSFLVKFSGAGQETVTQSALAMYDDALSR